MFMSVCKKKKEKEKGSLGAQIKVQQNHNYKISGQDTDCKMTA